jgi:MFS superfamily sulfate permease-like transporter
MTSRLSRLISNPTRSFDFVLGLLLGVVLASLFFVIQNSRRRPIRAVFSGATAKSTVRRPHAQRQFIQQVGSQTCVMKLQGFRKWAEEDRWPGREPDLLLFVLVFFGTITRVEDEIRRLLDIAAWQHNPIRFLSESYANQGASRLLTLCGSRGLCPGGRSRLLFGRGLCADPATLKPEGCLAYPMWR